MPTDIKMVRDCRAVLLMIHELHLRGYQRLRAIPAMSPSGGHWRCWVAPVALVSPDHGARIAYDEWENPRIARYTSGMGHRYFDWTDVTSATTPSGLARRFVERFPQIVAAGQGSDWLYVGWYVEMLHLTYPDQFPYAMADYSVPDDYIPTTSPGDSDTDIRIPLPPPGEGSPQRSI